MVFLPYVFSNYDVPGPTVYILFQGPYPGPVCGCGVPAPPRRRLRRGHVLQRVRSRADIPRGTRGDNQGGSLDNARVL